MVPIGTDILIGQMRMVWDIYTSIVQPMLVQVQDSGN